MLKKYNRFSNFVNAIYFVTAERFVNDLLKPEDCLRIVLRTQAQFANENAGCAVLLALKPQLTPPLPVSKGTGGVLTLSFCIYFLSLYAETIDFLHYGNFYRA